MKVGEYEHLGKMCVRMKMKLSEKFGFNCCENSDFRGLYIGLQKSFFGNKINFGKGL